jgi:ketosteroid isomerase-like protein
VDDTIEVPPLIARYVAALNAHDPDAVVGCVTDDFANRHTSELGRPTDGRGAYRDALPRFFADVPGLRYAVEGTIVADGGSPQAVAYRLTADGGIDVRGVWWLVLRDGLIASRTDYWDSATVLRQRGA